MKDKAPKTETPIASPNFSVGLSCPCCNAEVQIIDDANLYQIIGCSQRHLECEEKPILMPKIDGKCDYDNWMRKAR
ncbi:MAG: hypothetical protein ACYST3_09380 [Planctomycetota bacterium]